MAEIAEETAGSTGSNQPASRKLPGEEMACLQISVGILGVLLLVFPALTSFRGLKVHVALAGLALLGGVLLAAVGGFMGLKPERQRRAHSVMRAGGVLLTLTAIVLLIASSDGLMGWDFPVGAIFLTLGLISDLATHRFRRALAATPSR
ncbi:MAG TPA: hypothetical protein VL523_02640 [Terriglobia bacterium]|nr:hypothetical protein [Terriglobia bacterium]